VKAPAFASCGAHDGSAKAGAFAYAYELNPPCWRWEARMLPAPALFSPPVGGESAICG